MGLRLPTCTTSVATCFRALLAFLSREKFFTDRGARSGLLPRDRRGQAAAWLCMSVFFSASCLWSGSKMCRHLPFPDKIVSCKAMKFLHSVEDLAEGPSNSNRPHPCKRSYTGVSGACMSTIMGALAAATPSFRKWQVAGGPAGKNPWAAGTAHAHAAQENRFATLEFLLRVKEASKHPEGEQASKPKWKTRQCLFSSMAHMASVSRDPLSSHTECASLGYG